MESSAIEGAENINTLVEFLRRLGSFSLPWFVGVTVSLAAAAFVTGISAGAAAHRTMLAFGIGLSVLLTLLAVLGTYAWNFVRTIIPILEISVMDREALSMTLREHFASKKGSQDDSPESSETIIGETYTKIISCLCRLSQIVLFWCPCLAALVSLTCLAFGVGDGIPASLAGLYIAFLSIAVAAIVGFLLLRLRIRRVVTAAVLALIDPYLQTMLKDLESDDTLPQDVDEDSHLEGGDHPVALVDLESAGHSVLDTE